MSATTNENRVAKGAFETEEAARQAKPSNVKWKLFRVVAPGGTTYWTWAGGGDSALVQVAKSKGFAVSTAGAAPTRERVAGMLAQLSPEDRAALMGQFTADNGAPAPVAEKAP